MSDSDFIPPFTTLTPTTIPMPDFVTLPNNGRQWNNNAAMPLCRKSMVVLR